LTGALDHHYEAALARPDLAPSRAALGHALAGAGRPAEAVPHLRAAVEANPFDGGAARALYQALRAARTDRARRQVAQARRLLAQAAPALVPPENWFVACPPVGDELASLVILCCNQLDFTRLCLQSVLRYTRGPYELILVDNGSTDDTPAYLDEIRGRSNVADRPAGPAVPPARPERVVVLRNETNRGFAAGCNQGLAQARGRYLVLLNNDTLVTPGWLEGLIEWVLTDWPVVGMVGPVSGYAAPPQQVPIDYRDTPGLEAFTARRRRDYRGQALAIDRLTGFCLLVRREVLQAVGGLDEAFGLGFFEDDDLCLRARQAGFRLLVAQDVFVHHFGSRTFAGLGLDTRQQLQENFDKFRAKWGEQHASRYRPPAEGQPSGSGERPGKSTEAVAGGVAQQAPPPAPPSPKPPPDTTPGDPAVVVEGRPRAPRPKVSLCLIVKDEEENLPACLASAADLVDEVIVVDTGSQDRTKEVAQRFGARVFDFPWVDDFAAARNESLRHARGEWVFWLDADDRLDADNRAKLRALFAGLKDEEAAYVMSCLCLPDPITQAATAVHHLRLFRNRPDIRWSCRVHEQILPAVRAAGHVVRFSEVIIQHTGYQDPALRAHKLQRDLRLLESDRQDHPDDPFTLFNLGQVYQEQGRKAEALALFRRSLAGSQPPDSIVRKLYALIAQCHNQLGQRHEALAACRADLTVCPGDPELLFQEGAVRRGLGDTAGAETSWRQVLQAEPGEYFASVHTGLRGYLTRHNLAGLYRETGRDADAESQWRLALQEWPDYEPAWRGLADLLLTQRRWDELEALARGQEGAGPAGALRAVAARARIHLARREFAAGRALLEGACASFPGALEPRQLLSYMLLQEGRDWAAAEAALRALLALDPADAEARHNLTLLRAQLGKPADLPPLPAPTLAELYGQACNTPSAIQEHCPTLSALARHCRHVTALGARGGAALAALLYAQPATLVCYDPVPRPELEALHGVAGQTEFVFCATDVLGVEIEETDLLFIDTRHIYDQLKEELGRHARKARRYVVLPGTTAFADYGEEPGHRGVWDAVAEFVAVGMFRLKERYTNNHGLTVLERVLS
jgi:GT2 family glycosyltransferase/tetratricopeptide (TPR) repeat protein